MENKDYAKAYTEVYEILRNISSDDFEKIPEDMLTLIEENRDKAYKFHIDNSKGLDEYELTDITKGILAILYRDYWASDEEKEVIYFKEKIDRKGK